MGGSIQETEYCQEITDEMFVKEMRIFWENLDITSCHVVSEKIRGYFNHGNRAEKIISHINKGNL